MKKIFALLCCIVFLTAGIFLTGNVHSDELDDITKQISQLQSALSQSQKATAPLLAQLNNLQTQLKGIENRVTFIENDIIAKKKIIDVSYAELAKQKVVFDQTVRNFYIKNYAFSPLVVFVSARDAADVTRILAYQKRGTDQDKAIITNIAIKISDIITTQKQLESEESRLSGIKEKLAVQKADVQKIVTGAQQYQASLSGQIATLSAKQQSILAQRLSSLGIPLFASSGGSCSSDLTNGKSANFSGGFGLFTYGVPNRVGLNQYGAFGRAKAGKGYEEILRAYYNFDSIEKKDATINVEGYHGYSLDEYTKRIYEVPNEWGDQGGMEALRAQAIAARSYALAYTNNGSGSICTTQQCQVFQDNIKTGNWEKAVDDTAGLVMIQGGNAIKAWFSSTHGGYIHSSDDIGWSPTSWTKNAQDTTGSIASFSDLKNNAYDKESPWFYCDWGARSQYGGTAWLKSDEIADIVNVVKLASIDSSVNEHLYQTDKGNPAGTDTWDAGTVKQKLKDKGVTPFNSVSDINVDVDWGSGKVSTVHVNGDAPDPAFSGSFFKTYFNLRAPANIQIVGPLYNRERN